MEKQEERKPFQSGDAIEDMMGYARKLKALGAFWSALSWHENREDGGDTEALNNYGEAMGEVIMDYSGAIEIMLEGNNRLVVYRDKNIVFPIAEFQHAFEWLSKTPDKQDIFLVGDYLRRLKEFRANEIMPVFDLIMKLEDLLKKKQASTPEASSAAAGA